MTFPRLGATLCLLAAGCMAGLEPDPDVGVVEQALIHNEAVMTNAVMTNAVMTNAVMTNSAVTSVALSQWASNSELKAALLDSKSRDVIKYAVECALDNGDSVVLRDSNEKPYTMKGLVGLAPTWKDGTCSTTCQQWISSCLLARTNARGVQVRIAIRSPDDPDLADPSAKELAVYNVREAAFYGNLFGPLSNRKVFAAHSLGILLEDLKERMCDGGGYTVSTCPFSFPGVLEVTDCSFFPRACTGVNGNGAPDRCYAVPYCTTVPASYNTFEKPITVFRAKQSCPHAEHETGLTGMSSSCSPCAYRVIVELGKGGCLGSKGRWDSTCVNTALAMCGDHDVCATGDPMVMGDSACIDEVCTADETCCKPGHKWDSGCVALAEQLCGATCD